MPKFIHPLLPRYLGRVLSHTLKDWRPRVWAAMLTILSLTVATWLQPLPPGTINLSWDKWKATVEAWGIVLVMLLLVKVLCAQWKVHKEDQAQIEEKQKQYLAENETVEELRAVFRASCTLLMQRGVLEKDLPALRLPESTKHES